MPPELQARNPMLLVAKKELLEIVRDRRSLLVLLLLPVALYPLMFIGTMLAATAQLRKMESRSYLVWHEDPELPKALQERLETIDTSGNRRSLTLRLEPAPPGTELSGFDKALAERRVSAVIRTIPRVEADPIGPAQVEVLYNGGIDASVRVARRLNDAIDEWRALLVKERLAKERLSDKILMPVVATPVDRGPPGALLGRMLSVLLVVLALTGAFYPALDLGAGEKERGTLETLLLAPVPRVTLALGKFLAVFLVALVSAVLHLLSLALTFTSFAAMAPSGVAGMGLSIPIYLYPAMLLVLLPLVALFSALSLALATFAASYKEGQAYLTPVMVLGTLPAVAAALPGMELTPALCVVPVLNASLLMKGLLAGTVSWVHVGLVVCSSFAFAALAVRWVGSLYEQEEVLWRPAAAAGPDLLGFSGELQQRLPNLPQGLALATLCLLLFWFVGLPLQRHNLPIGVLVTLVFLIALPAVAYANLLGCDLRRTFSFQPVKGKVLVGAVLLGLGWVAVGLEVAHWQTGILGDLRPHEQAEVARTTAELLELPYVLLISLLALAPALCEEVLFRGFVLTGLRRGGGTLMAILVSSILFAVFHLDPNRLLPTFLIGLVLGTIVVRTGSIFPAVIVHLVHNATLLLAQRHEDWVRRLGLVDAADLPTWTLLGPALSALVIGGLLLFATRPPTRRLSPNER